MRASPCRWHRAGHGKPTITTTATAKVRLLAQHCREAFAEMYTLSGSTMPFRISQSELRSSTVNQEEPMTMLKYVTRVCVVSVLAVSTLSFAQKSGADTYKSKCQSCHGADGSGNTPAGKSMKAKPFSSPDIVSASDADLIADTKNGKGKMPAYASKLTDDQIKDVVAYIRTLQKK